MTTITRLLTYTSTAVSTGVQIIFVVGGALEVFKVSLFGSAWDQNMGKEIVNLAGTTGKHIHVQDAVGLRRKERWNRLGDF